MANYKQTPVTGDSWQRCRFIQISNALGSVPQIQFTEETVLKLEGFGTINKDSGYFVTEFNPNSNIDMVDVHTGEPTGETVTHQRLYEILHSLYLQEAHKRDIGA